MTLMFNWLTQKDIEFFENMASRGILQNHKKKTKNRGSVKNFLFWLPGKTIMILYVYFITQAHNIKWEK